MRNRRRLFAGAMLAGLSAGISQAPAFAASAERLYCLSNVCPGDPRTVLSGVALSNLAAVAERPRARGRDYQDAFKAAVPGLSDAERMALSAYADSRGSLLLDARTLPLFLKIDRICAPVGPFVALFTSESGHASMVEFGATLSGTDVRLGVTRIGRSYQVNAGSAEEKALIADLSRRFGFQIDAAPERNLRERGSGTTAHFTRQDKGFVLAFSGAALAADDVAFAEQSGCTRIKID